MELRDRRTPNQAGVTTGRGIFRCSECHYLYWRRRPHSVRVSFALERYWHLEPCPGWRP